MVVKLGKKYRYLKQNLDFFFQTSETIKFKNPRYTYNPSQRLNGKGFDTPGDFREAILDLRW